MILPIVGYGDPVLRKVGATLTPDYPQLSELIHNMYDTMYNAYGVGLAAPQIGLPIRLFVIDTEPFADSESLSAEESAQLKGFKRTFINAQILKEEGEEWGFNEGCLSIPDVREDVYRKERVTLQYCDEHFVEKTEVFDGLVARVIQHEYDHIEGVLFTDKINPFKRKLISGKLTDISKGKFRADYKTRVFQPKR